MGYSISHKGYVCYDSCANKFCISRNEVFFENQYFFPTHIESLPEISILPCFDDLPPLLDRFKPLPTASHKIEMTSETGLINSSMPPEPGPRRSSRVSRPPDRYGNYHTSFNTTSSSISIPTCFSEAVKHECWQKAMDEELQALQDNHTWDVVPCPSTVKPLVVNRFSRLNSALMGL